MAADPPGGRPPRGRHEYLWGATDQKCCYYLLRTRLGDAPLGGVTNTLGVLRTRNAVKISYKPTWPTPHSDATQLGRYKHRRGVTDGNAVTINYKPA